MIISLEDIQQSVSTIETIEQLTAWYDQYLGKTGTITAQFKTIWSLTPEDKKIVWAQLSTIKTHIEQLKSDKIQQFRQKYIKQQLLSDPIDSSLFIHSSNYGHFTLLQQTRRHIENILISMGFAIEYGKEVVSTFDNFFSLNFQPWHPAIEMHDTFYIDWLDEYWRSQVLRTHGTAHYHDMITRHGVPLKLAVPSRDYRNEDLDASHDVCFMQIDAAVIDRHISIANFKDLINKFLHLLFEKEVQVRLRPWYFPFVEPWFEIDATCPICGGVWCSLCKHTWWIEILWAGMLHDNVLKASWVNTDIYNGYAFGAGISRLVAIKYGINDIRLLTNGDLRFIKSWL